MIRKTTFLILGSGIAGLSFALAVAESGPVLILTKKESGESNTNYAQGGIAAVWDNADSFEKHIADTKEAGAGLCHPNIVEIVVKEGPERVRELIRLGVDFSKDEQGGYELAQEGGHSARRVLHAKDATGREIERALLCRVKNHPNITVLEHHVAIDARVENGQLVGMTALNRLTGKIVDIICEAALLATGGAGKVYLYTSNPDIATGDGIAIAYRAGVPVANLEFVQFHPTCLYHADAKSFLISEALRGEGALLKTKSGRRFMPDYHDLAELAPRDVVAQAIDQELKKSGDEYVLLDLSHHDADFIRSRFPTIYQKCLFYGFDLAREPIPVVPAAHYFCGGVVTDEQSATHLKGLYAAGEVAFTGLHGANRLASNSLLEALVFAKRASDHAIDFVKKNVRQNSLKSFRAEPQEEEIKRPIDGATQEFIEKSWDEIRKTLWQDVGIVRTTARLMRAQTHLAELKEKITVQTKGFCQTADLIELGNLALVASLVVECALKRHESRGLHQNTDYPTLAEIPTDTVIQKNAVS